MHNLDSVKMQGSEAFLIPHTENTLIYITVLAVAQKVS